MSHVSDSEDLCLQLGSQALRWVCPYLVVLPGAACREGKGFEEAPGSPHCVLGESQEAVDQSVL